MPENPLQSLEAIDPDLIRAVEANRTLALSDGALPRKYKYLIAMVLDATHGADGGVRNLATAAMHAGATKEEIADALRVAYFIDGVGSVYVAARGLDGLL